MKKKAFHIGSILINLAFVEHPFSSVTWKCEEYEGS